MTKVERFQQWVKDNPKRIKRIYLFANTTHGLSKDDVDNHIKELTGWLERCEHTKRGNYKQWGNFISRNLGKRKPGNGRAKISKFSGESTIQPDKK